MSQVTSHAISRSPALPSTGTRGALAGEFFRYHGIWAPGVRLFRNLGFRTKAFVIALTFLLPIALLSWNYFRAQQGQVDFSAKERLGVRYAQALMPLLDGLQRQRTQAALAAVGQGSAPEAGALSPQLERLQAVQGELAAELGTAAAHADVLRQLKAAPAGGAKLDAVLEAHHARVLSAVTLLSASTDGSNLTLDPDIDTYYLMDAAMFRLPAMLDAASQLQAVALTALHAGAVQPAQQRALIEQLAVLRSQHDAVLAGVAKSVAYNAELGSRVQVAALDAALKELMRLVEAGPLASGAAGSQAAGADAAALGRAADAALAQLMQLTQRTTQELDALVAARVGKLEADRNLTFGVLIVGLLAAVYVFESFRKVLEGGMREVDFHLQAIREGDLTTCPSAWGGDEAATLMQGLARMQESLRGIVQQVRGASGSLLVASQEISHGATDLSARTEESCAHLQQTSSAMEQIAATVKNTDQTVEQAMQLAETNAGAAERGGQIIGRVVTTMDQIHRSSGRIGEIIGTIDSIAFQTNILALNAAVEAARAGEQGRGFAVVASEVRALAQRSAAAAREIKGLISESVGHTQTGAQVVKEAGDVIGQIVANADGVRGLLTEVASTAREQNAGVIHSARSVQELDAATQQNAALVEQTAAAAGSLHDQARMLADEVARFKLPA